MSFFKNITTIKPAGGNLFRTKEKAGCKRGGQFNRGLLYKKNFLKLERELRS